MKKVRKNDLIILIASLYCEFVDPEHKPINDIVTGCNGDIIIDVNSIYISVRGNGLSNIHVTGDFAKNIEDTTFGNLKVTRVTNDEIFIANAYEVID